MNNHATVQSSAPVSAEPLLQVSGALIAIIALILAAAWLVKRLGFAPKRTGVNGLKISASASLVAPGADAGVHHLVDVHSSDFTDDDQFHPHHYCFWFIA